MGMHSFLEEIWADFIASGIWRMLKLIWVRISGKDLRDKQIRQVVTQDFEVRRSRLISIREDLANFSEALSNYEDTIAKVAQKVSLGKLDYSELSYATSTLYQTLKKTDAYIDVETQLAKIQGQIPNKDLVTDIDNLKSMLITYYNKEVVNKSEETHRSLDSRHTANKAQELRRQQINRCRASIMEQVEQLRLGDEVDKN